MLKLCYIYQSTVVLLIYLTLGISNNSLIHVQTCIISLFFEVIFCKLSQTPGKVIKILVKLSLKPDLVFNRTIRLQL